jgi:hypothetical protein
MARDQPVSVLATNIEVRFYLERVASATTPEASKSTGSTRDCLIVVQWTACEAATRDCRSTPATDLETKVDPPAASLSEFDEEGYPTRVKSPPRRG